MQERRGVPGMGGWPWEARPEGSSLEGTRRRARQAEGSASAKVLWWEEAQHSPRVVKGCRRGKRWGSDFLKSPTSPPRQGPRAPPHFKAERNQFDSTDSPPPGIRPPKSQRLAAGSLQDTPSSEFRLPVWLRWGWGNLALGHPSSASALSALRPEAAPARGRRGRGDLEPGGCGASRLRRGPTELPSAQPALTGQNSRARGAPPSGPPPWGCPKPEARRLDVAARALSPSTATEPGPHPCPLVHPMLPRATQSPSWG